MSVARRWAVIVVAVFVAAGLRAAAQECFMLEALDGSARYVSDDAECRVRTT